jgi:hypothetical protein
LLHEARLDAASSHLLVVEGGATCEWQALPLLCGHLVRQLNQPQKQQQIINKHLHK